MEWNVGVVDWLQARDSLPILLSLSRLKNSHVLFTIKSPKHCHTVIPKNDGYIHI
jgi:hypothetical protein